jgi:hypothetical protein
VPFIYFTHTKQVNDNYTTSGTANTEIDFMFLKPGASRPLIPFKMLGQGKGAALTNLNGLVLRAKHWTSTASSAGTGVTPAPKNNLMPACVATAGLGTGGGTAAVTSGTGGPNIVDMLGMGASGPGGVVAADLDDVAALDGGATKSFDLFSVSAAASLGYEAGVLHREA